MTWRLTSLLLATCCCSYLVDLSLAHSGIGCFVPGECVNGTSNGVSHESSSADCLNACKESAFCNEFTFYGAEQICVMFETCPGVSADNCGDCVSGEAECGDQQCDIDGACVDSLVGLNEAHSKDECISQCQDNAACLWWTFNAEESLCEQLSGCDHIDPECEGCVSGETSCKAKALEYLFVVGGVEEGSNDEGTTHVQAIDMSGKQRVCDRPRRYPFKVSGEMARRSNGNPVICGGSVEFQDEATKLCRMYNPVQDQWDSIAPMKSGRRYFGSVQLNEADFWAVSGDDYDELTGESEIFNGAAMSFYDGPELPEEIGYLVAPCMVQVNRSVSALTGGKNGPAYGLDLFYLYDHDLEQWIQMPPMKTGRYGHGCGLAKTAAGQPELVVTAGELRNSTEIFDFTSLSWRRGQNLPVDNLALAASVQFGDGFLLVGGYTETRPTDGSFEYTDLDTIFQYDADSESFVERDEKLSHPAEAVGAVMVTEDVISCVPQSSLA